MRRLTSILRVPLMALAVGGFLAEPANAAALHVNGPLVPSNVTTVQGPDFMRHQTPNFRPRGVYRHSGGYYYGGHRVYRNRYPGYHYYNGWWIPPALFLGGMAIGGAIANQPGRGYSDAHVRWCYQHYRSYRAYDNTFQPYNGPRRQCRSPYY